MRRPKRPVARITVEGVPRRWWQRREVRLRCTCGWVSTETWPTRPSLEVDFALRMTMRMTAEAHFGSPLCRGYGSWPPPPVVDEAAFCR